MSIITQLNDLIAEYKTKLNLNTFKIVSLECKVKELEEEIENLKSLNQQLTEANKKALQTIEDAEQVMATIDQENKDRETNRVVSVDENGRINFADTTYGKLFFSKHCRVTAVEDGVVDNFNELAEMRDKYEKIIAYIEKRCPEVLSQYMKEFENDLNKRYIEWCDKLCHPIDLETMKPILIEQFYKNCEKYQILPEEPILVANTKNIIPNGSSVSIDSEDNPPVYRVIGYKNGVYTVRHANLSADEREVTEDKVFLYRFQDKTIAE